MKLNLKKPLVVFDLETTGLDIVKDRIIQISYIKVSPDGTEERKNLFVNPERTIPEEVVQITGITNEQVKDAPTFKQLAQRLSEDFTGCDFAGFNSNHFDVPMLAEEFIRAGVDFDFSKCRLIDVQTIFHKMEKRNLAAAYKFYTGRKMEDDFQAHLADQDTEATYLVLQGQLDMYAPGKQEEEDRVLNNDMEELAAFSKVNDNVDFAGRIVMKDNEEYFTGSITISLDKALAILLSKDGKLPEALTNVMADRGLMSVYKTIMDVLNDENRLLGQLDDKMLGYAQNEYGNVPKKTHTIKPKE